MHDILIIGGGVAGLTAAVHLAERGVRPLLLEADPLWVGGRLHGGPPVTFEQAGQRWSFPSEHGIHGIWWPYVNLRALLERLALTPAWIPAREETWMYGRGRVVRSAPIGSAIRGGPIPAPFHYLHMLARPRFLNILSLRDFASLFRVVGGLFAAMAIDPLREGKALEGMSLADFTAGWSPTLRSLFAGLARNALSAHPESAPASGFIAFLRFYTLMRRDSWRFDYLPGTGGQCVVEPLARQASANGCELRLGCRVTRLEQLPAGWRVDYHTADGAVHTAEAVRVVLALDAPAAQRLLCDSPATATVAAQLRFPTGVPTAIIRQWFGLQPRSPVESGMCTGDFVIDNFFWLQRILPEYGAWAAATGGAALETHIYGPSELLDQPDAVLLARVLQDTYRAFPELRGALLHSTLDRNPPTHTLFSPGAPETSLAVDSPWPGLVACGDWVSYPVPALYLERAVTTGIAAANVLLAERGLEPWPLLAHPAPEWFARQVSAAFTALRYALLRRKGRRGARDEGLGMRG